MGRLFLCAVCCAAASLAAPDNDSAVREKALLERVRGQMADNLTHLPNYTCFETIERVQRPSPARRYERIDMVRLEVALADGKELFSWPGAAKFDDKDVDQIVRGGLIGNGSFALHAKIVFQTHVPQFTYAGDEMLNDRPAIRWDYSVGPRKGGWELRFGPRKAIVGSHGSFWVDAKTLDVIRLEVIADDIPPELQILRVSDSVDYMRAKVGDASFLLPEDSELRMLDADGTDSMNRIHFTSCRQYLGESKLIFDDTAEGGVSAPHQLDTITLPDGLTLTLELETPIQSGTSAVGDLVTFKLKHALKYHGAALFDKGSPVHGRITMLQRENRNPAGYVVGIRLMELLSPSKRAPLNAALDANSMGNNAPLATPLGPDNDRRRRVIPLDQLPKAVGSAFFQPGASVVFERGTPMVWRTVRDSNVE